MPNLYAAGRPSRDLVLAIHDLQIFWIGRYTLMLAIQHSVLVRLLLSTTSLVDHIALHGIFTTMLGIPISSLVVAILQDLLLSWSAAHGTLLCRIVWFLLLMFPHFITVCSR